MNSLAISSARSGWMNPTSKFRGNHPALLQLIAISPVLWWFAKRLNDGNDETLGLLTLSLAAFIAWRDRESLATTSGCRLAGALLLVVSVLGIHSMPPMIRAGLAICGIATFNGFHRRAGLMGLLVLSLPVAASMQFFLGYPMRVAAAEGAVRLLELGSLVVTRSGTQIALDGQVVGVDPACAGVRMLWHALAAAMALAAYHRLTWRATMVAGLFAVALVIPANTARATLLAVEECGYLPSLLLGHGGIGLLCFGVVLVPLWLAISSRARVASRVERGQKPGRPPMILLGFAAFLAPVLMWVTPGDRELPVIGNGPEIFTFDGLTLPLTPLPPSAAELAFAGSFPGSLASYQWGTDQVILRRVTKATRRLHPSSDCLRAAGFVTTEAVTIRASDGSAWARFHATRDGVRWTVSERIISERNHATWTDVSAWWWAAIRHPLNGPWRAETVISES